MCYYPHLQIMKLRLKELKILAQSPTLEVQLGFGPKAIWSPRIILFTIVLLISLRSQGDSYNPSCLWDSNAFGGQPQFYWLILCVHSGHIHQGCYGESPVDRLL